MHTLRRFSFFVVSTKRIDLKFDYNTKKKNQNNERTTSMLFLIECLLSLTLISRLNCVSLGMTRINKLWGGEQTTNQFLYVDVAKKKSLRTLSVEIVNDDLNFPSRCWHTRPHHILGYKSTTNLSRSD